MKLIVGLGNPGKEYENTRHNVGFMLVNQLANSGWRKSKSGLLHYSWLGSGVELIKPQQFMNRSGEAVKYAVIKHEISFENILILHDDLDLKLGDFKLQTGKGPKVHNGVNSVTEHLGDAQYPRLRIGIDNRQAGEKNIPGAAYVLAKFSKEEGVILQGVFSRMKKSVQEWYA